MQATGSKHDHFVLSLKNAKAKTETKLKDPARSNWMKRIIIIYLVVANCH